jgi:uncharacterized protein with GYD domain
MGKYLLKVTYTPEGARGLLKEGGSARRDYVKQYLESVGGTIEAFYFAFGEHDAYLIIDAPSDIDVAGASLTVGASGAVSISTVVLLSPEQIDEAVKKGTGYRPPGA